MLSTGFSARRIARRAVLAGGLALAAAACTPITTATGTGAGVNVGEPVKVALLVPLGSGDPGREEIGRSLVNAARMAQQDLQDAMIDLAIYETGGSSSGGASAAGRALGDGAQIIVGPLFSTETAGVQSVAQSAGIPVLSFSNNPEVAGGGVYLLGLTFESSADRVVAYAMSRGLSNVGVVHPRGLEGETARRAVTAAVRNRGANLVATQSYDLSVQGIQGAAPGIVNSLRSAGANAVVLTDGPTGGLGFISEALRSNGLAAGSAQFLGMQRWDNSAEALALDSLQGGWFAAPDPGLLGAFRGRYQQAYGESPHELAGLAYDGIAAVGALVRDARAQRSGDPFSAERLTQPAGFAGVQGAFRFLPNGTNQRNLAVLEVSGGSVRVVSRAARTFEAPGL